MGCAASKVDNEDTVRRCKDRRRLIKEAVYARHQLAAAHADYIRFLRLTGLSLASYATFEPLSVSDQTPPVFIHSQLSPKSSIFSTPTTVTPPPPPPFSLSPTIPNSKLPHILSTSSSLPDSTPSHHFRQPHHQGRRKSAPKLPHILSESSPSSSPRSQASNFTSGFPTAAAYQGNSNYSGTPSQASSIWNWENFYPPSPPESEFFNQRVHFNQSNNRQVSDLDENETERSEYDFFESKGENHHHPKHDFTETEREEVQCSEWGDHYSTTTSSSDEEEQFERGSRTHMGVRSNFGSSVRAESVSATETAASPPPYPAPPKDAVSTSKSEKWEDSSTSYKNHEISDMKMVVRHKDLKEIVDAIKDNFVKAAEAGDQVSELLETGRAQLDSSFRQLKKTVYHSSSMLRSLSSSWTSKPPLAVKYRLDALSLNESGGSKSLCSTLERLLAWEKKLYEEVKAREGVKIEHEKKLSVLQSQENKGEDETKLDKTKTSIKRLQSLIIVTSQAVSTTSTAVISLRNSDLVPQLVDLCHAVMYMWKSMHQYHEVQNNIVQQVRGLVNLATKGTSTSELHRQATRDLESAVSAWHTSFCRIIKFQREFIHSLYGWLKLSLIPVDSNNLSGNREPSDVYAFFDEWKLALDRVPDTVASEAIKSFINVVHVIFHGWYWAARYRA